MAGELLLNEFNVSNNANHSHYGRLLVTDVVVMLREGTTELYYKTAPYSVSHFSEVMSFIDQYTSKHWYICTDMYLKDAHRKLDQMWYAFFDGYCQEFCWINARVRYIGANGKTIYEKGYGFDDGEDNGTVYVFTREFWKSVCDFHGLTEANWTPLLEQCNLIEKNILNPIEFNGIEQALNLKPSYTSEDVFCVKACDSEEGYLIRGFKTPRYRLKT